MNVTRIRAPGEFWDRFAPWYECWQSRGNYHRPLVAELSGMVERGWKVLDVGAATGTLSIPLASLGWRVNALEPSTGMGKLLQDKVASLGIGDSVRLLGETWEDFRCPPDREKVLARISHGGSWRGAGSGRGYKARARSAAERT